MVSEKMAGLIMLFGGLYTMVLALGFILFDTFLFAMMNMMPPDFPLFHKLGFFLVFMFGLAYVIASRNLSRNRDLVLIGIIEKIGAFGIFLYYYLIDGINITFLVGGIGDLILGILFLLVFLSIKKSIKNS